MSTTPAATSAALPEDEPPEVQAASAVDALGMPLMMICVDRASVFAAYYVAHARGLTVGVDVSILGVGLLPANMPVWPSLCCFQIDRAELVASLTQRLIAGLEGAQDIPRHVDAGYCYIAGDSCGQAASMQRSTVEGSRGAIGNNPAPS